MYVCIFLSSFPVFLAAWIKGLIAVVVIGVIIGVLILGARCYILKKAKGKYSFLLFHSGRLPWPGNWPWK